MCHLSLHEDPEPFQIIKKNLLKTLWHCVKHKKIKKKNITLNSD